MIPHYVIYAAEKGARGLVGLILAPLLLFLFILSPSGGGVRAAHFIVLL
mgnify:CR=1 FL=1